MKKTLKLLLLALSASCTCVALAATDSVMVVNNSPNTVNFGYALCNSKTTLCTYIQSRALGSANTQNNHLSIVTPLNSDVDVFAVTSATMTDQSGKIVAKIESKCELPKHASAIILNDYGTGRVICQYGQVAG